MRLRSEDAPKAVTLSVSLPADMAEGAKKVIEQEELEGFSALVQKLLKRYLTVKNIDWKNHHVR